MKPLAVPLNGGVYHIIVRADDIKTVTAHLQKLRSERSFLAKLTGTETFDIRFYAAAVGLETHAEVTLKNGDPSIGKLEHCFWPWEFGAMKRGCERAGNGREETANADKAWRRSLTLVRSAGGTDRPVPDYDVEGMAILDLLGKDLNNVSTKVISQLRQKGSKRVAKGDILLYQESRFAQRGVYRSS